MALIQNGNYLKIENIDIYSWNIIYRRYRDKNQRLSGCWEWEITKQENLVKPDELQTQVDSDNSWNTVKNKLLTAWYLVLKNNLENSIDD
jgi:hypothetical protein